MSLKLMYITNNPDIAKIAERSGVDRIFVDMEYIGKRIRQKNLDTVVNSHKIIDIKTVRHAVSDQTEVLVRVNPIHKNVYGFLDSKDEIPSAIEAGADIVMLPFFKTAAEVKEFVSYVDGKAKTTLLLETPEAVDHLDEILDIPGIDEIHIGLNDLSLGYGNTFLFEPLANGTVDKIIEKFKERNIPYGFGGVARIGLGIVPAEYILGEHRRLGSSRVILSKSFANATMIADLQAIDEIFSEGVKKIRDCEAMWEKATDEEIENNRLELIRRVGAAVEQMR